MATAGSGDMLSGMISAFLANGTDPVLAAVSAVCLHGAAGEKTASKLGVRGMIVSDMIDQLPFVLN
jgi:NAD(P)H-hydrate epimerase